MCLDRISCFGLAWLVNKRPVLLLPALPASSVSAFGSRRVTHVRRVPRMLRARLPCLPNSAGSPKPRSLAPMGFEVLGLTALARCLGNSSTVRHESRQDSLKWHMPHMCLYDSDRKSLSPGTTISARFRTQLRARLKT